MSGILNDQSFDASWKPKVPVGHVPYTWTHTYVKNKQNPQLVALQTRYASIAQLLGSLHTTVTQMEAKSSSFFSSSPSSLSSSLSSSSANDFGPSGKSEDETDNEKNIKKLVVAFGLASARFKRCPKDYYSWKLEKRRAVLQADSVHHLCKSIVLVNSKCPHEEFTDRTDSKYYFIIIQYTGRLHNEKLIKGVRSLRDPPIPAKLWNFRLCPSEQNDKLTGYSHNGVCPIGTKQQVPYVMSHRIAKLAEDPKTDYIWMGGGEVDLKFKCKVSELIKFLNPLILDITYDEVNEDPPVHGN
jgi:prolyl-tRNA editing enzyme YbaK/EbsC (Cys-tRNA(Pro) deacylase)